MKFAVTKKAALFPKLFVYFTNTTKNNLNKKNCSLLGCSFFALLLQKVYTEDLRPASTSKYVNFLDYIEKADDFLKKKKEQCKSTLNVIKEYMEDNKNEISI